MRVFAFRNAVNCAFYVLALALFATVSKAQQMDNSGTGTAYARVNGVKYSQGRTSPLLADMYLPAGKAVHPAIVFIHGGGWTGGSRGSWSKLIAPFAARGYVGMAVDYDLSPSVRFPVALEECKQAVRWLRAHAAEYHVDPNRIAVAGGSAGGELAALVALTGSDSRYETGELKGFSSAVQAAILYSADLDLTRFSEADPAILAYLGSPCRTIRELCIEASPQFHLSGRLPPIFIGHGDADDDVPYSQFTSFVAAYREKQGKIATFTAQGGSHSYAVEPRWFQENADAALRFLQEAL